MVLTRRCSNDSVLRASWHRGTERVSRRRFLCAWRLCVKPFGQKFHAKARRVRMLTGRFVHCPLLSRKTRKHEIPKTKVGCLIIACFDLSNFRAFVMKIGWGRHSCLPYFPLAAAGVCFALARLCVKPFGQKFHAKAQRRKGRGRRPPSLYLCFPTVHSLSAGSREKRKGRQP